MAEYTLPTNGSSNWGTPLSNAIDAVNAEVEAATAALEDKLDTADAPDAVYSALKDVLVAGADNVTLTPDDEEKTITVEVEATGGGSVSAWGDIGGNLSDQADLQEVLDDKLDTADAPELIRDTVGTALVAGNNVSIAVNDAANSITISSSPSLVAVNGPMLFLADIGDGYQWPETKPEGVWLVMTYGPTMEPTPPDWVGPNISGGQALYEHHTTVTLT